MQENTLKGVVAETRFDLNVANDTLIILKTNSRAHTANNIPAINLPKPRKQSLSNVRKKPIYPSVVHTTIRH